MRSSVTRHLVTDNLTSAGLVAALVAGATHSTAQGS